MITLVILAGMVIGSFVGWQLASHDIANKRKKINEQRKEIAQEIWRRYNHTDIELPDE